MFAHRTATGLTIALLALPATATARPLAADVAPTPGQPYAYYYSSGSDLFHEEGRTQRPARTSTVASSRSLVSPDAADAARAGEIAKAMEHYQRSLPIPAGTEPASHPGNDPAWPEIAFAGLVVLAAAGGIVRVRLRRDHRVAA
jgi:hypothetical protein